jgi:predicted enzyme related to lactoylglutathione lyase
MEKEKKAKIGAITWFDLTAPNADELKNFYSKVVGWKPEEVSMGDYSDYNMKSPDSNDTVAGICNAKGTNADLPSCWMMYITVNDIKNSLDRCKKLGGEVITEIKDAEGYGKYCVIKDPAGAVCALFEEV